ncbi:hypothetical protein [Rhodococcus sp. Q]|uniref:hypothetical protein n=1 Tax=Rhodococcus sp. Q TaxID=2502252 RepID=UPI0010F6D26A|nr:hypothetical protein [Rhodococcus sp. Q]
MAPITAGLNKLLSRDEMRQYEIQSGTQVEAFGFTCAVGTTQGVSCREDGTGHGFSVTREAKSTF